MSQSTIYKLISELLREDDGTTSVEYAVMISLILATLIGSFYALSFATQESFNASSEAISGAFAN